MLSTPAHVPLVVTTRGGMAECVHVGSIAVVDRKGKLIAGAGEPGAMNFTRSALKPLQALGFVQDDGMARFGFGSAELALMCASHSGEAIHVATAAHMLASIGASPDDLQCGCHAPYYYAATGATAPAQSWSPLHHNCSGKHAGFLAYCRLHGQRLDRYLNPMAPLQKRVRTNLEALLPRVPLALGIDGCSAPNFAMPLAGLAQLFCRLALGESAELDALRFAMTRHPDLVSGTARADLALMLTGRGDWVTKGGANGVQAIGVTSRGIGIALRIADGNARALHTATIEALLQLGLLDDAAGTPVAQEHRPAVRNLRGTEVGRVEPVFRLPRLEG
jgi:L-asparaginase II